MSDRPILFLVFNRPEHTQRVFDRIREVKPKRLFVAADGPRRSRAGETDRCENTRAIATRIDWDCELKTLFREENLGCGKAVSSAIDWFFSEVEDGIILEDDCLPRDSFFSFCDQMLEFYRADASIMHIGGSNFQNGSIRGDGSYYFSRLSHVWGWATWKDRWQKYDYSLHKYRDYPLKSLNKELLNLLKWVKSKHANTWDVQWLFSVWFNNGISVTPNVSLIENIGFDGGATHTRGVPPWYRKMIYGEICDLKHPTSKLVDGFADELVFKTHFRFNPIMERFKAVFRHFKHVLR